MPYVCHYFALMTKYREQLYTNYTSTQENRGGQDQTQLFNQQVFYFTKEIVPFITCAKQGNIVDIGCGNGSMVKALQNAGFTNMQGIDLSAEQVEAATKLGVKNIVCNTAEEFLKDKDNSFDAILAIDVIEHFTKDELVKVLAMIRKALKPGGIAFFRTPNMDAPLTSVYSYGDFTHECLLNKSSAEQVMLSCGFNNAEVHPSMILAQGTLKEMVRKLAWQLTLFRLKFMLFSSGRTWDGVVFTPNLLIKAIK